MAKDPAFLFYPGDWLGGTMHMTKEEKGCYMDLLILQFNKGAFTLAQAKHMLGTSFDVAWPTVSEKFKLTGDLYLNERLELEKEKRSKFSESRRNNAKGTKELKNKPVEEKKDDEHMPKHMEDENRNINDIINYLNMVSGKSYKSSSQKTRSLIIARIKEGYSVDDFKKVISVKQNNWMYTDQEVYIRPETLFGNKFESYLNEKPINRNLEFEYQDPYNKSWRTKEIFYRATGEYPTESTLKRLKK